MDITAFQLGLTKQADLGWYDPARYFMSDEDKATYNAADRVAGGNLPSPTITKLKSKDHLFGENIDTKQRIINNFLDQTEVKTNVNQLANSEAVRRMDIDPRAELQKRITEGNIPGNTIEEKEQYILKQLADLEGVTKNVGRVDQAAQNINNQPLSKNLGLNVYETGAKMKDQLGNPKDLEALIQKLEETANQAEGVAGVYGQNQQAINDAINQPATQEFLKQTGMSTKDWVNQFVDSSKPFNLEETQKKMQQAGSFAASYNAALADKATGTETADKIKRIGENIGEMSKAFGKSPTELISGGIDLKNLPTDAKGVTGAIDSASFKAGIGGTAARGWNWIKENPGTAALGAGAIGLPLLLAGLSRRKEKNPQINITIPGYAEQQAIGQGAKSHVYTLNKYEPA